MKKQNTCHVYNFVFKKIQEIYVLRKTDRKEFKKFGPETIETQALIYRSEKLKILQDLGSRSKVQGRLGLEAFGELEWITWRTSGVFFVRVKRDLSAGSPPGLTDVNECRTMTSPANDD